MIQDIEELRAELEIQPLVDLRVLIDRQVPLLEWRTLERIAPQVAEVLRPGYAVRYGKPRYSDATVGAGHGKGAQIKKVIRVVVVVNDRPYYIGPVKAFPAPAVIVFAIVVKREGLAALQRHAAIEAPPILQLLPTATQRWHFVGKNPGEAFRYVEVRWTVFVIRIRAVRGLRGIGNEIFAVARIVQGTGPHEVYKRRDAVPRVYPQAGLERVVIGFAGRILLEDIERSRGRAREDTRRGELESSSAQSGAAIATGRCPRRARALRIVDGLRGRLVDVEKAPEPVTLRTHVTHLQRHFACNLLLDV